MRIALAPVLGAILLSAAATGVGAQIAPPSCHGGRQPRQVVRPGCVSF